MNFRKKTIAKSEISTASMPDIVFLLLFFFMVSATMKKQDDQVKLKTPEAHALTEVQKQFLIKELHVGKPKNSSLGIGYKISAENKMIQLSEIGHWVETQRATLDETYKDQMIVLLRADENVDMGFITDIQQELRKYKARKILYRTLEK
ncbi:MAG: biopolymer transporter ExbD [Cytophagales bacterium]|nr:biopolymer transporter ExbD [Cytophagales bacterium]